MSRLAFSSGFVARFYINTSASLSGATLLATYNSLTTVHFIQFGRVIFIRDSTNTQLFTPVATSNLTDPGSANTQPVLLNINWAVDQYLILAVQPANVAENHTCHFLSIHPLS